MSSSSNILHLLPLLVSLAIFLPCIWCDDIPDMIISRCGKVPNTNQPSPTNADKMISNLLNFAPQNDFSYYTHQDTGLYGLAWCLGDAFAPNCSACLAGAAERLMELCSHQTTSARIVFQDFCYLRVDTIDFIQTLDFTFGRLLRDNTIDQQVEISHQGAFSDSVKGLVRGLKEQIVQQSNKRFARGQANFDVEKSVINGMAQCLDQLSPQLCETCLEETIEDMMVHSCMYSRGCQIFKGGSCILQYSAASQ